MAQSGVKVDARQVEAMLKNFAGGLQGKSRGARAGYFDGDTNNRGVPLAKIAVWNEFGTEKIPPRPFLRNAQNKANKHGRNLVKVQLDKGTDVDELCAELAVMLTDEIRKSIRAGAWTANKPDVVDGKHGAAPLVDTGQLLGGAHGAVISTGGADVFLAGE